MLPMADAMPISVPDRDANRFPPGADSSHRACGRGVQMSENVNEDCEMDKATIVSKLREYEGELKAAGVEHLLLHGSYARGTAVRDASDVDVVADFDLTRKFSLIGRVHLENRITDILGLKADLSDRKMLRPEVLERVERESVLVF